MDDHYFVLRVIDYTFWTFFVFLIYKYLTRKVFI